ncbi:MAG: serine/threonine-protein kinase [Akkermansia sp.]|nr:serine/threonine-protein kinase [Akkermansia sp.]
MAEEVASSWKCPDCGESLDSSKLSFLADVTCPKCGREGHANTSLANFRLDSILGIGGMSVVMRAYDPALGRPVAIKLLNDTYRDQEDRIRKFEGECSLMAKVRHENVVSVYSAGWARGQFYIAMELVDGENLEFIIDRRKFLLPNQAVDIIRQVALGLKAAHEAGLLHRDVKPGNVIITKNNQAKVLDFGLSMEDLQEEADKEEVIWATPFYVPPETLRREREDVRSDIYALGMTLRNLLTGEDKLNGEFHSVTSLLQLKEKYPTMRSTYPHLDAELCDFVDRMSAFKPDDRPADYGEVLAELAEVSEHLAKVGQRRATRLWLAEKKREIMILAGSALLGIILATTVVCSTTEVEEQRYLNVPAESTSAEWQELTQAENMLISAQWKPAADLYAKLAEKANDPAAGLRAGMLGAALKTMLLEPDAAAQCRALANRHLAAAAENPLMAQGDWQEMEQVLQALQEDAHPDARTVDKQRQPMLRVVLGVLAAADAMNDGRTAEAQSLAEAAVAVAEQGSGGVGELATILNRYKLELAHQTVPKLRELVLRQLGGGMLEQAQESMNRLAELQLSPAEKAEMEVQRELCLLAQAAFEAYRKHGQDPMLMFASPKLAHDAAKHVKNDPTFINEMSCLSHMLRGEYGKAFAEDPYKDSADSQKPFAVLMRAWRQKLGRP